MAAPQAALLLDELVEEILLLFPPDNPARLVAAALVCKRWCRLATGRGFRRRFRKLHRVPPLLGFLCHSIEQPGFRFVPTSSFRRPNAGDRRVLEVIHSAHGRVLLRDRDRAHAAWAYPLVVWDPLTDEQRVLPIGPLCPHLATLTWSAAVLCAAGDRCDHLDCHTGPFLVVYQRVIYDDTFSCCVYSSEAGSWSKPVSIDAQGHRCRFELGNVALVGSALYFKFFFSNKFDILKYDLVTGKMSLLCVPEGNKLQHGPITVLMATDDGRLGCAFVGEAASRLFLWSRKHAGPDEEVITWEQSRAIELNRLLPIDALSLRVEAAGFAGNGDGVVLIRTRAGLFAIDLRSGRVKKAGESHGCHGFLVPYTSFCTPALG